MNQQANQHLKAQVGGTRRTRYVYIIAKRDGDRDVYWFGNGWTSARADAKQYATRALVNQSGIWQGSSRYAAHVVMVQA